MNRALRWSGAVAVAALALTGCVRTTVDTTITADGTFSQSAVIAFSDEVAAQIGDQAGMDVGALFEDLEGSPELAELQEQYPGQIVLERYDDGELEGVELTITDLPVEEFNAAAEQTASGIGGAATLELTDGRFVLEMASPEGVDLGEFGVTESQLGLLESSVDVSVTYTFPGLIEEASVGEVDGRTVTLGLTDLVSGQDIRIVAAADDQIDWGPLLRWGGIALAFLLVVGGATALIVQDRRKHRESSLPPPVTTEDPHGPGLLGENAEPQTAPGDAPAPGDERIGREKAGDEGRPDGSS
ncbi:LppM family (lipo)protein [Demequina sp. SO4-13]|uniref:LppM family (lipo)protein n=1 Tax=Demequina sp. SO4-13 TaxID=3401027 RepID=UPI003AF9FF92